MKSSGRLQIILFFIALGMLLGCSRDDIGKAHRLLKAGDFIAARDLYARQIKKSPLHYEAHYGLGLSWCAEAIYKTELGLVKPLDWYPAIYQVSIAANLGGGEEVRRTLAVLHFNLGATFRKEGQNAAAAQRLEQALTYDSTLLKALNLLGAIYHEAGDLQRAQRCYERAVSLRPGYAMAHFNLGAVAWARGDMERARDYFAAASSLDSSNALYRTWLGKASARAGAATTARR